MKDTVILNVPRSQFPDSDALLLMYAVGELPPEDRQVVEAELDRDPAMRQRLEAIHADLALTDEAMRSADEADGLAADRASRRAIEAIRNWQLVRPVAPKRKPLPLPERRWGKASAAAALVAVGLGVAALVSYLNPPAKRPLAEYNDLPELTESGMTPLALNAANSLALGVDIEDDEAIESPMPPEPQEPIVSADQTFFDVPLIADADD